MNIYISMHAFASLQLPTIEEEAGDISDPVNDSDTTATEAAYVSHPMIGAADDAAVTSAPRHILREKDVAGGSRLVGTIAVANSR